MIEIADIGKKLLDLALRPRYSFTFFVFTGLVLSQKLPAFFRLDTLRIDFGPYIGAVCLFSFLLWIVEIVINLGGIALDRVRTWRKHKEVLDHLATLNLREAGILNRALESGCQTLGIHPTEGEVNPLVAKGLLEKAPEELNTFIKWYTIPSFVFVHINKIEVSRILKSKINSPQIDR